MDNPTLFSDLDLNFERNPSTDDISVKLDDEAVKRSLRNLLMLRRYEKPFHPEINPGIYDLLFENPGPVMAVHGKRKIEEAIMNYEPRIDKLEVNYNHIVESGALVLNIRFTIMNQRAVFETNIHLEKTR
jgi:uncharacterized protein